MFLANENFPRPSTTILRENGFLVKSIQEDNPGIADQEVMQIALELNLIILTFPPLLVLFTNSQLGKSY